MAQEMAVSDKTIRRDLETFEQAGFPLLEQIGEFGRKTWRLEGNSQPGLAFTFDEAIALYLSRRFLEPLAGTLFWEAAGRAFKKIRATLGPRPWTTSNVSARCSIRPPSARATTRRRPT